MVKELEHRRTALNSLSYAVNSTIEAKEDGLNFEWSYKELLFRYTVRSSQKMEWRGSVDWL